MVIHVIGPINQSLRFRRNITLCAITFSGKFLRVWYWLRCVNTDHPAPLIIVKNMDNSLNYLVQNHLSLKLFNINMITTSNGSREKKTQNENTSNFFILLWLLNLKRLTRWPFYFRGSVFQISSFSSSSSLIESWHFGGRI